MTDGKIYEGTWIKG